ncbi:uncharacterized protein L3040_009209 [Drepanopeziza brunnea f. sp. 'multigermtubi']|uniref:uncharacterized protein n=1 Tax=Drepanopeziza brunnea f. sp. 'multigermtubi' TaxID=698441 RepID=UPI0023A58952|nr:hypothetical protein L3040_009209 [Drepanopeziza brunnea f. sp. 'multigermtubi']
MTSRILAPSLGIIVGTSLATTLAVVTVLKLLPDSRRPRTIPSPRETQVPYISREEQEALPYPPDVLPGARDVTSPYGTMRVYEWGPEAGRKVVLAHGISTPCIALSNVAHALAEKGCRVLLFDLFGRGYSDSPELPHDSRLYATQILLAITSSPLAWTPAGFSLVGYSLGGGIAADFAASFPDLVKSIVLLAPSGLIKPHHFGWQSRFMYSGFLPASLLEWIVKGRLGGRPADRPVTKMGSEDDPSTGDELKGNRDPRFESTVLMRSRPGYTVADVVSWQIQHHAGFVRSFVSSMMFSAIESPRPLWGKLGQRHEKILILAGEEDPVILAAELREDAEDAIGSDKVDFRIVQGGGHEFPMNMPDATVREVIQFWDLLMRIHGVCYRMH